MSDSERNVGARLKAEAVLAQRPKQDEEIIKQREKEREAEAAKTARLRELRLAKEAAEAQSKPEPKAKRRVARAH
jgi:hypothetical protein